MMCHDINNELSDFAKDPVARIVITETDDVQSAEVFEAVKVLKEVVLLEVSIFKRYNMDIGDQTRFVKSRVLTTPLLLKAIPSSSRFVPRLQSVSRKRSLASQSQVPFSFLITRRLR